MDRKLWNKRWRRALWAAWWLRMLPYVRMVGLNGSMVTGTWHQGSDIDFFIVVRHGHIFTSKIITTMAVQLLGIRRHGSHVAGRICLNRYATEEFLEITPHNTYHARVFHNLIPLYSASVVYKNYMQANAWMEGLGYPVSPHQVVLGAFSLARLVQGIFEFLLTPVAGVMEGYAMAWQQKRFEQDTRVKEPGSVVILTPYELRFHLAKEGHGLR